MKESNTLFIGLVILFLCIVFLKLELNKVRETLYEQDSLDREAAHEIHMRIINLFNK